MIIADTNVWSEPLRRQPDETALEWVMAHRSELTLTTITIGELLYGVAVMSEGKRRAALSAQVERLIAGAANQTYEYDAAAARHLARIRAHRRLAGRGVATSEDAMIAAIASVHGCPVATRNVGDFADMGVEIINPWQLDAPMA